MYILSTVMQGVLMFIYRRLSYPLNWLTLNKHHSFKHQSSFEAVNVIILITTARSDISLEKCLRQTRKPMPVMMELNIHYQFCTCGYKSIGSRMLINECIHMCRRGRV